MDPSYAGAFGLVLAGSLLLAIPNLALEWAKRSASEVVFSVETGKKVVALSIDDGPSSASGEILEILAAHEARATFFLIGGHLERKPELGVRIVEAGHEVGHHMMEDRASRELPAEVFEKRFDEMDRLLEGLGGSRLFRPGSGWFDDRMVRAASSRGYRTVLGSVYSFDAHVPWPSFHAWYVLRNTRPGSILVLHEGDVRGVRTAEVLRVVLPELTRRGYRVVTVSSLLELDSS